MKEVVFVFHQGRNWFNNLTRFLTQGKYTHVSIMLDDTVYEAVELRGVIKHDYGSFYKTISRRRGRTYVTIRVSNKKFKQFKAFLEEQVGKKYDYYGILNFVFSRIQPRYGYWYCSELAQSLFYILYEEPIGRLVSPQRFYERLFYHFKLGNRHE